MASILVFAGGLALYFFRQRHRLTGLMESHP
jgi:hypothetical protein